MIDDDYGVHLAAFNGPLDLLLHLVRSHEVEIRDLPLAEMTGEYLEMLKFMEAIDLEPASEFLEIAATLVRIKAQALLPSPSMAGDAEALAAEEEALLEQLVEHQVTRMAARELRSREARIAAVWFRGERDPGGITAGKTDIVEADLFSLVTAFRALLAGLDVPSLFSITADQYPVTERVEALRVRLRAGEPLPFDELFQRGDPRGKLIATFLALLELVRSGEARAFQEASFGAIVIFPVQMLEQEQ
ncbi:MAG TPA: segregation/condensation protein A [Acidobacteriota bacterium]